MQSPEWLRLRKLANRIIKARGMTKKAATDEMGMEHVMAFRFLFQDKTQPSMPNYLRVSAWCERHKGFLASRTAAKAATQTMGNNIVRRMPRKPQTRKCDSAPTANKRRDK